MAFNERGRLALLVFSGYLGAFASTTFAPHAHIQYFPQWEGAAWIGPAQPAAQAYFRKEIILGDIPVRAQAQIAAPDGFDLYVNGNLVTGDRSVRSASQTAAMVSASTSKAFEIAPLLREGKNVIAIKVNLVTRPAEPRLLVEGSWQGRNGTRHRFVSDGSWRVAAREEWQAGLKVRWYGMSFSDLHWPAAAVFSEPNRPMQYLDVPPGLFRDFPRGDWIWNHDRTAQQASFRRTFRLQGEILKEAWIGISSDAAYSLAVNDLALISGSSNSSMDTYDIARYLRWGDNTVTLNMVREPPQSAPRLAVALTVELDGRRLDFSSGGQWLSWVREQRGSEWAPVAIAGQMGIVSLSEEARASSPLQFGIPQLRFVNLPPPMLWWLERIASGAAWFAGLLACNLLLVWLTALIHGRGRSGGGRSAWSLWTHACATGTVLLGFLFLLQYDVRLAQHEVFVPAVFFAVWGVTLLWVAVNVLVARADNVSEASLAGRSING